MSLVLSLIWLFSITGILVALTKKKSDYLIPLSVISGSLLLYLAGMLNNIKLGYIISWLLIASFYAYLVLLFRNKKDEFNKFINNYCTIGLIVFGVLVVFAFLLTRHTGFSSCDEFTHWGPMVRETFNSNKFYALSGSEVIARHQDYPPFFSLLEVLFCYFVGSYSESVCYFALIVFMFSLFIPAFSKLELRKKEDYLKAIVLGLGVVFVGLTVSATATRSDEARVYNSIYSDWSLGLFTAYGVYVVYKIKEWDLFSLINVCLIGVTFLLMKQTGMFFYGVVVVFSLGKLFVIDRKYDLKLILKGVLFLAVIPLVFYASWKVLIAINHISGQFSVGQIEIFNFYSILKGRSGEEWQREIYRLFKDAILHRTLVNNPIEMSYFAYVGLICLSLIIIIKNKFTGAWLSVVYAGFGVAYAVIMLVLYIFSFGSYEGLMLASFDRYMLTYLYMGTCLVFMICADSIAESNPLWLLPFAVVLFLFIEKDDIEMLKIRSSVDDHYIFDVLVIEDNRHLYDAQREEVNGLKLNFDYVNVDRVSEQQLLNTIEKYEHFFAATDSIKLSGNVWNEIGNDYFWIGNAYDRGSDNKFYSIFNSYIYFVEHYYFGSR